MKATALALLLTCFAALAPVFGMCGDLPFSSDLLGSLTEGADIVVKGTVPPGAAAPSSVEQGEKGNIISRYSVVDVEVQSVLQGRAEVGDKLKVAIPASEVERIRKVSGEAILFLRNASEPQLRYSNIKTSDNALFLVNGLNGLVPITSPERLDSIRSFLELKSRYGDVDGSEIVDWAIQAAGSEDALIAKSAFSELDDRAGSQTVVNALAKLLTDKNIRSAIPLKSRIRSVGTLGRSSNESASRILGEIAQDKRQDIEVRRSAVSAIGRLEGGESAVRRWVTSKDPFLKKEATAYLKRCQSSVKSSGIDRCSTQFSIED